MAPIKQFSASNISNGPKTNRSGIRLTGNVFKVTSILEPGTTSRDVVSGALALSLDKNRSLDNVLAVPRLEGLQELKSIRRRVDSDGDGGAVSGRSLEGVLSGVVALGGELMARGVREPELLAVGTLERICHRVESEVTGKDHGSDKVRGGNKGMGSGVGIVSTSEVSVVGGDDWNNRVNS